jgi:FTR1 family protein
MLVPFLIMLREGMEAALIVGIVASYLRQTGRRRWLPAVWAGVVVPSALCLALGIALNMASAEFPQKQQELFEGVVGLIAVVILTSMIFWMRKAAASIGAELRQSIDAALRPGGGSGFALVAMVFLAVGREGLESVFFLLATFQQNVGPAVPAGALLGLFGAIVIGWGIYRGGVRLNLRQFFNWTGMFIIFVAAGLLTGAVRALHEAGVWNGLQTTAFDLSGVLPSDGPLGTVLAGLLGYSDTPTVGEVAAYLLYLVPVVFLFTMRRPVAAPRMAMGAMIAVLGATAGHTAARAANAVPTVDVTVTDAGCTPPALSVPAGKTLFRIHNASRRAMEWEILKGVEVVEERENIIPGFVQNLTATLGQGEYLMTCGLLSNPKGALHVVGGTMQAGPPSLLDLVGPIAEYKVYVIQQTDALLSDTRAFVVAVQAGRLQDAQRLYAPAHQHYERVEPIAELFNDLDESMDARADDFEQKAADAKWIGFHRIEKALFADQTTDGMAPVAAKLLADADDLCQRVATLTITPKSMVGGAADLIEEVASKKITGEEDRYSRTDLWDFQANLDGAQKIVALLHPLVQARDAALAQRIDENFAKVDAILARYRQGEGFTSYAAVTPADRNAFKGPVTVLAEDLSKLRGTLGVE